MSSGAAEVERADETSRGVRGSSWLLIGRLFAVAIGLLTQVVLVRALTKTEFGLYALGIALALGLQLVVTLGHNRVISRFFSIYRERRDPPRLVGILRTEVLLICSLGLVTLLAAVGVWLAMGRPSAYASVLVLLVLAPSQALEDLLENLFAAFGKVLTIVIRQHVLIPLLRLVLVGGLAAAGAHLVWLSIGYVATSVISLCFYAVMYRRLVKGDRFFAGWDRRDVAFPQTEVFRFSLPMLSGEVVYLINGTVNVVLLGAVKGSVPVGALRAIIPFADANLLVRRQFFRLFVPLAAALHERGDRPRLRDAYWSNASWVAVLTFPLFCITGVFAGPVTRTLLGADYASSATYLTVFAAAYYLNAAVGFNAELLSAVGRLRWITGVNVVTAVVALGGSFVLIHLLGALGVAIATASSVVVQNVLNQWGTARVLGGVSPPPAYRRVHLSILVATVVLAALRITLDPGLISACVVTAVASLVVLSVCVPALRPGDAFPELRKLRSVVRAGRRD